MTNNRRSLFISLLALTLALFFIGISNSPTSSAQTEEPVYVTDLHLLKENNLEKDYQLTQPYELNKTISNSQSAPVEPDTLAASCLTISGSLCQGSKQSM